MGADVYGEIKLCVFAGGDIAELNVKTGRLLTVSSE